MAAGIGTRMPQEAPGDPGRPQESPVRPPREAPVDNGVRIGIGPGGVRRLQKAPGGHQRLQEAPSRRPQEAPGSTARLSEAT